MSDCLTRYKERIAKQKERGRIQMLKNQKDPKFCEARAKANRTPERREKLAEGHRTPESRDKARQTILKQWQKPEFRENVIAARVKANKTPEMAEVHRLTMLKNHQNPEFMEKIAESHRTPEMRKLHSDVMLENWKKPGFNEACHTPENNKLHSQMMIKNLQDPEFRKKMSDGRLDNVYDGPNGHIPMKSSWEVLFAELLDHCGFTWKYEPVQYDMSFEELKTPKYTPDFWVNEFNCYFEVKGYFSQSGLTVEEYVELARIRAEICQLLHNVKVVVLDGPTLEILGLWNNEFSEKKIVIEKLNEFSIVKVA